MLPAHGNCGAMATINNNSPSPFENILAKPKSMRAKKRESGGNEFLPAYPASQGLWWERFLNSALAKYQNRKIFFSLIEKIFAGGQLKKNLENFSVLLA